MSNKIRTAILCFFMACSLINAQKRQLRKAEYNFNQGAYTVAIESYQKLVDRGNTSPIVYKNLGDAYYYSAAYTRAVGCYQKILKLDSLPNTEYQYRYAQSLKSLGAYKKSDLWMKKFCQNNPLDPRAIRFLAAPNYLKTIEKHSNRGFIKNMPLNSEASDFAPTVYKNKLIFASARDSGLLASRINARDNQPLHNLYNIDLSQNSKVGSFSKQLNTKAAETTTALSKDGNTLYFTRNSLKNGKLQRDKNGYNRTQIYRCQRSSGEWSKAEALPFNDISFSVAHPALSANNKKLYFASDMPGGYGLSDLYSIAINEDGSFGKPQNLGPQINTIGRDSFPYISKDSLLYFASDGHLGLGGLDVFVAKEDKNKNWCVQNVGKPINSKNDDFSFVFDSLKKVGYFSSNREGGIGNDDIYSFKQNISLVIRCKDSLQDQLKTTTENSENIVVKIEPNIPVGTKLAELLKIDPVLFEFNEHKLSSPAKNSLVKVAAAMLRYPDMHIKVEAHTDATGSTNYNMLLSEKRAKSTMEHLINLGIHKSRISFKSFGESHLINDCNKNNCTLKEKLQNRRAECIVSKK